MDRHAHESQQHPNKEAFSAWTDSVMEKIGRTTYIEVTGT
jgi:hypothetical protein